MELKRLRRHVMNRGGLCEVWLVYIGEEEPGPPPNPGPSNSRPRLARAFWTRAEAGEWAQRHAAANPAHHCEVYRIPLDERWISENTLRPAYHVPAVPGDPSETGRPSIAVTPGAIAHAFR